MFRSYLVPRWVRNNREDGVHGQRQIAGRARLGLRFSRVARRLSRGCKVKFESL